MKNENIIEIKGLQKSFNGKQVLKNINLEVKRGENLVIIGKSGQGKSVTLKCLIGMIEPDAGEVKLFDREITDMNSDELLDVRKCVGYLFQNGALYDSMSVRENLSFALKRVLKIKDENEITKRSAEVLEAVGLSDTIDKMPSDLSGGMRKRMALARTLIVRPEIILYDEPTTGLDTVTSREISELILKMQEKYETTSIIITHDMACAKIVADRIVIMNDGEYIAEGSFDELSNSEDDFIRSFFK